MFLTPLAVRFLPLVLLVTVPNFSHAASQQKCAEMALRALHMDDGQILRAERGEIRVVNPEGVKSYENGPSSFFVRIDDRRAYTFEKTGGRISKAISRTATASLDENCNLEQAVYDNRIVTYDRKLCMKIAEHMARLDMDKKAVEKCSTLEIGVTTATDARSMELRRESKALTVSSDFGGANRALQCAVQLDFEQKKDGLANRASEYLSQSWVGETLKAAAKPRGSGSAPKSPVESGTTAQ